MIDVKLEKMEDKLANQYGIYRYRIVADDKPTKKFIISKTNPSTGREDLITITGSFYKIIPNEVALKIADEVFIEWLANPLNLDKPIWTKVGKFKDYSKDSHIISNGKRLHAYYKYGEERVGDDTIYFGVNVINSIDGTTRLGLGGFTYRVTCQNQVLFGQKAFNSLLRSRKLETNVKGSFIEGELIEKVVKRHTSTNFPDEKEISRIFGHFDKIIASLKEVIEIYRNLQKIQLNKEIAQRFADELPKVSLPPYIVLPKKGKEVQGLKMQPNLWTTYNDITASIWHRANGSLVYREEQFDNLHRVIAEVI